MPNRCQPPDGRDSRNRPESQHRKAPTPAGSLRDEWNELHWNHRQEKPQRRLNRQGGADCVGGNRLSHEGAELGAVGDDEESPRHRQRSEHPYRSPEEEPAEHTAAATHEKRDGDEALSSTLVCKEPAPD